MFYVCVVCMVSVKGKNPLIKLTGARCQLWELIISPRINTEKIKQCLLLVCAECNQLLSTMLEFRRTMYIGAKNLLFLYKNLRSKNLISSVELEPEPCHELPAVIEAQSDELLPVVNEEVVQSDTCWADVAAAAASVTAPGDLAQVPRSRIINPSAVQISEHNVDYAVLIPINEETNWQYIEDVVYSSAISETSKIEESVPEDAKEEIVQAEFPSISDSSKVKKIKLNRQLFEAIRVTLKSPSLTEEFDIKYEPESESESECKSEAELAREWAHKLVRESALKSKLDSERKSECKSALKSESKSACESALESESELEPDSESTRSCESDYEDPEHFPNIIFAKAFNGLADKEPQMERKDLEQGEEVEEHIHCHLVTNPPSEWPCTGEQCRVQSLYEEGPKTPGDSSRDTPIVRSKTKDDVAGRPKCKLCSKSFDKISMLWQHFERAHIDASLKCNVCRKEFRNETELTSHKMKHQFKKTVEYQFEAPSRHMCLECAVRCKGARHLRLHLGTRRHAAKMQWRFQCDICKRKCPDKKQMAEHIQREHLAKDTVKCSMCSASFKSARTLRRHVAKHIVESQTQTNKAADKQTNGQARKRARDTHTKGHENTDSDILRNVEETQTEIQKNGQRKKQHHISRTSNAGHIPPKSATMTGPLPGHQSTLTTTKRQRKTTNNEMFSYTNRRRKTHADTNTKEQEGMEIKTNGQTSKKPRKTTNKVNKYANRLTNELIDTYINEQDDMEIQTNKQTRKIANKKVNTYANRQAKAHTDTYINEQDDIEKQANGQTRKKQTFTNKQENIPTDTYVYRQENTHKETHSQARKDSEIIHANGRMTHTDIQEIIPAAADTRTHKDGRVRKRRKRRTYVTTKRARMMIKAAAMWRHMAPAASGP